MSEVIKLLITGKKDKLWKAVGAAYSGQAGVRVTVMPIGSAVIETVRGSSLDAVLYTISSDENLEPLRWVLQMNPSLTVIALLPREDGKLRKAVLEEGVEEALVVSSLEPRAIRASMLGSRLRELGSRRVSSNVRQQISEDLHAIRSTLTAILGTAEMALKRAQPVTHARKHIKDIPKEAMEIEKILRRIHRTIKSNPPAAGKADRTS
jgi:hypothetical protein